MSSVVPRLPVRPSLTLRCRCGTVALGVDDVSPSVATRVICHCAGCRAYAARMDPAILDDLGGSDRFQVSPARVRVLHGADQIACVHQTPKGALRWYARCCRSPLALTLPQARVPFVGLDTARIDPEALGSDPQAFIGPVLARVNGAFPRAERRGLKADVASLLRLLRQLMPLTLRWWWRGDQRRGPFFDKDGQPTRAVEALYPQHRGLLKAAGCR